MHSSLMFVVVGFLILLCWLAFSSRGVGCKGAYQYFKNNKGIMSGVRMALIFTMVFALIGFLGGCATKTGTFFNEAKVYSGIDHTMQKSSPQCHSGGLDAKSTSNLGLKLNLFETTDSKFKTNVKYTHHSCAFNKDQNLYDAVGVEVEYIFWDKNSF